MSIDSRVNKFDDLPFEDKLRAEDLIKQPAASSFVLLESFCVKYPNNSAFHYHLGIAYATLCDMQKAIEVMEKVDKSYVGVQETIESMKKFLANEKAKVAAEETVTLDPARVFHKWAPIAPLPASLTSVQASAAINKDAWIAVKNDNTTLVKLQRLWSIETGKIENLYSLTLGVTQSLINLGFLSSLVPHQLEETANVTSVLQDQLRVLEQVMDRVGNKNSAITANFLKELQYGFTATARLTTVVANGQKVKALIKRGEFKFYPNSPTRQDGLLHQYCPPSKVAEQVDSLVNFYLTYSSGALDAVVLSAWLHHRFVQIHPFMDGNGRVARAIASIPLLKAGLPPLVIMADDRNNYIAALQQADQFDNLQPLIDVIVKNVNHAITFVRQ